MNFYNANLTHCANQIVSACHSHMPWRDWVHGISWGGKFCPTIEEFQEHDSKIRQIVAAVLKDQGPIQEGLGGCFLYTPERGKPWSDYPHQFESYWSVSKNKYMNYMTVKCHIQLYEKVKLFSHCFVQASKNLNKH